MVTGGSAALSGLRTIRLDLHLHTVVSPCAEVEMIPPLIVRRAHELGLDLIAVTDHNTADNVGAMQAAGREAGIAVLPGMEVQTREEVHLVCLFDSLEQVVAWQAIVYNSLPQLANRPDVFGAQFVVDATGEYVRENERLLLTSVGLSTEDAVAGVRALGGLPIAAHVDRPSFSLIANLGFVPDGLALAALEISRQQTPERFRGRFPHLAGWPLVGSSDAHQLTDMAARMTATLHELTVAEIELALQGTGGRSVTID